MIKVKNLFFKYAESPVYAIHDITCNISQGKYVAILGHNGSGKSTFSKLLVGLYKGNSGTIEIDGLEMNKQNLVKVRSKIGIVFQNPDNQFVGATVEDDIAFGLENKNLKREEMKTIIMNLVEKVGMEKYLEREPQNLSGGQKQRVAIASTLALNPEIIIFDEVTSMLDPRGKVEILNLIKQIQKDKKKTLISITHDMDEAILADEVIVLSKGRIVAQGKPQDVLSDEKIIKISRIDNPFIYKLSTEIFIEDKEKTTFSEEELLEAICK